LFFIVLPYFLFDDKKGEKKEELQVLTWPASCQLTEHHYYSYCFNIATKLFFALWPFASLVSQQKSGYRDCSIIILYGIAV
jgi:hypothetical protein